MSERPEREVSAQELELLRDLLRCVQDVAAETGHRRLLPDTLAAVQRLFADRGAGERAPKLVERLFGDILPAGPLTWPGHGPVSSEPGYPEPKPTPPEPWEPGEPGTPKSFPDRGPVSSEPGYPGPKPPQPEPWEPGEPGTPKPPEPTPGPQPEPTPAPQPEPGPEPEPPEPAPEPGPGPEPEERWQRGTVSILENFLDEGEMKELLEFALSRADEFEATTVVERERPQATVDPDHRSSTAIYDIGRFQGLIEEKLAAELPGQLERLGLSGFEAAKVEAQITATGDGGFFRAHSDNGSRRLSSRALTFVYFFNPEPRRFEGGALRIYDTFMAGTERRPGSRFEEIEPRGNTLVLFPPELVHEVREVSSEGGLAESRLTLNGWLHGGPPTASA
jgi:SM-20-related protein